MIIIDWVALPLLAAALVMASWRLITGPSLTDRVLTLELIAFIVLGFLVTWGIAHDQSEYLDAALVIALISFLGTVVLAQFIERRHGELD